MRQFLLIFFFGYVCLNVHAQPKFLTIEGNHSSIGFEVDIAGGITKVTGKFLKHDLQLKIEDNDWSKSKIHFTIDVKSIDTGIEGRDDHLRTADFFDVERYPEISFISKNINNVGENSFEAKGVFSMHGITKEITIPFIVTSYEGNTVGIKIETSINRIDFGVGKDFKHTSIPNFLSDNIDVKIYFWTKRDKRNDQE